VFSESDVRGVLTADPQSRPERAIDPDQDEIIRAIEQGCAANLLNALSGFSQLTALPVSPKVDSN